MEINTEQPFDIGAFTQERKISDVSKKFNKDIENSGGPTPKDKSIHRSTQKPERNGDKPVPTEEKEDFVNEFIKKSMIKAHELGLSNEDLLSFHTLGHIDPELSIFEQEEKENIFQQELEKKAGKINVPVEKLKKMNYRAAS